MLRYEHGGNIYSTERILNDFSVNTNALGIPEQVIQALKDSAESFALYPDAKCSQLRTKLSECLHISENQLLFGNGAADLIFRICAAFRPKTVLTLAPTFSEYERPAKLFGAQIIEHRLNAENDFILTDLFLDDINDTTDMVFICNPNNPTGRLAPEKTMIKIIEKCASKGIYLVIDECFLNFTDGKSMMNYIAACPKLLILRAFTKLYSIAGLRLGYLIGNEAALDVISQYGAQWSVSVPAQIAGVAAISAEPLWTNRTLEFTSKERVRVSRALSDLGLYVCPSDANFLLVKGDIPLVDALLRQKIMVRACENFTGLSKYYFRTAIKQKQQNDTLINAVKEAIHG